MDLFDRITGLLDRLGTYPWWEVLIELAVIWLVVYFVFRFVQGTRAAGALKGILVLFIVVTLIARILSGDAFGRLAFLYDRLLGVVAIALVVIFQPELRRAVIRLGETPFFRQTPKDINFLVDNLADACGYLAKAKFGAIIVVERQVGLEGLTEGGTLLKAELSAPLIQTIFHPGTALHDLAVIVRGRVVHAAGVQLPLADPEDMPDPSLGSRHRAAVGLSKECDALVIIVSEETGMIRLSERGKLSPSFPAAAFRAQLRAKLERSHELPSEEAAEDEAEQNEALRGTIADDPDQQTADEPREPTSAGEETRA
ncbi:MAG TPA: TIGR00159 family protein [Phycisphaerales bacterium]|nr:TIGR00159 family protein [Phycisphaerales bacterium]